MRLSDFDYHLPPELIAQGPTQPRDHSRLMIVDRKTNHTNHDHFYNLGKYLTSNDVLVFNQSKVFPARLLGHKQTGGKIEVLLLRYFDRVGWEFISRSGIRDETTLTFTGNSGDSLVAKVQNSHLVFNLNYAQVMDKLLTIGHTPLPPYIRSQEGVDDPKVRQSYQTVYATEIGSVAAPTAGFHFTQKLLDQLRSQGIQTEFVTLHVGLGTFMPVKTDTIEDHEMHSEWYSIKPEVASALKIAKDKGKRIIAVGTTSVRTLETWASSGNLSGDTKIFIYPGYEFKFVDAMVTNFHQPKSTLLMLVSAFAGRELVLEAYQKAVEEKYRFHSFGDAMLVI